MNTGHFPPNNDPRNQGYQGQFQPPQFNYTQPGQFKPPLNYPPYYQPQFNPQRGRRGFWKWFETIPVKAQVSLILGAVFLLLFVMALVVSALSGPESLATPTTQTDQQAAPTNTPTPDATPTLLQVVQNSGKYDCCLADGAANVNDLEATETSDGTVMVLAKVVNLAWPANATDVGKSLIFQYMAAVWTSPYHPQNVTVTVMYQGSPTGAITATLSQATEQGTDWSKADPFDYWGIYDSTNISPSLS